LRSRRKELPNDFLPGNCPAVNLLVPVIFRKAIRDRAFKSFATALTTVSKRSTVEKFHPLPSSGLLLSHAFSSPLLSPGPSVLTTISHPSVRLGAKLVPDSSDLIEEKAEPLVEEERQGKRGWIVYARARAADFAGGGRAPSNKKVWNNERVKVLECFRAS